MANKKAAKKYILTTKRNQARNVHFKSKMKTMIKKTVEAINNNEKETEEILKSTIKQIDKTASKGIIHKNLAARKKSKLRLLFNSTQKNIQKKVIKKSTTKK